MQIGNPLEPLLAKRAIPPRRAGGSGRCQRRRRAQRSPEPWPEWDVERYVCPNEFGCAATSITASASAVAPALRRSKPSFASAAWALVLDGEAADERDLLVGTAWNRFTATTAFRPKPEMMPRCRARSRPASIASSPPPVHRRGV